MKQFDVGQIRPGSTYAAQFPDQHAVPGTKIPTLKELIDLVRRSGDGRVRLNIETKIDPNHPDESPTPERFVTLLLDLLRAEKFEDRVMVQSFDWRTLQAGAKTRAQNSDGVSDHARREGSRRFFSTRHRNGPRASIRPNMAGRFRARSRRRAARSGRRIFGDVTPALIAESHALGLKVVVWTVNKPTDMARLIEMGVDGIISDRPDLLRQVAGEKGIALPKGSPVTP